MRVWDEGVAYDPVFAGRGHAAEAAIGGAPLPMHLCLVVALSTWLRRVRAAERPVWFFAGYWFLTVNLAELIAYLWMRPLLATGDTGRFNQGLDLSPWVLFVAGSAFLAAVLWQLHSRIMPKLGVLLPDRRWIT